MEIKFLTIEEIAYAEELAKLVYRTNIEPFFPQEQMKGFFLEYVQKDALLAKVNAHALILWGAYEDGKLYAVAGMQPEGHITMLYVLPQYQGRGTGKALIEVMRSFAYQQLKLSRITVNAMPAWTAAYFEKSGFQKDPAQENMFFVSMTSKKDGAVAYQKRPIRGVTVAIVSFITLFLCLLIVVVNYLM